MRTQLKNLSVGDRFKYSDKSPEFELQSFIFDEDGLLSDYCKVLHLTSRRIISHHKISNFVYTPPYDFPTQLFLFK